MIKFFLQTIKDFNYLLPGFYLTLQLTFASFAIGAVLGLLIAILRMRRKRGIFYAISSWYINVLRGTPQLVQLLTIYFFLGMYVKTTPFSAAVIGLSINLGAYMSEAYRGVLESIHKGQWEAAKSLGMSTFSTLRRIILPQSMRILLPDITNYFIMTLLSSSLASVVSLRELTLLGQSYVSKTFRVITFFEVALLYFIVAYPMSKLSNYLEKKWKHTK